MMSRGVALATEDELSEMVGMRLVEEAGMPVSLTFRRGGSGYLRANMKKWTELALNGVPVVLLTDLDSTGCAARLISEWSGGKTVPRNLILRVVVREIEAWLLADHVACASLLGRRARLPADPEALGDPKRALLNLAKLAPRTIRRDLVAEDDAAAGQGLGYNLRLGAFVQESWAPERAAQRSQSLARARARIEQLAERLR
jgi:hypothetical protein